MVNYGNPPSWELSYSCLVEALVANLPLPIFQGWGCGYRSLQSLCSWVQNVKKTGTAATSSQVFPTPSTTETPIPSLSTAQSSSSVPSLHEIQEALVSMGDKPPSFVGSREWIGSFEVCIVLDHLYGVSMHACTLCTLIGLRIVIRLSLTYHGDTSCRLLVKLSMSAVELMLCTTSQP